MQAVRPGTVVAVLCPALLAVAAAAMEQGVGYAGDGGRVFPGERPPTDWDADSGRGVVWKTPLPNWSNGSPIVVAGRVFVLSEPLDYAPILTCLDAETGERLWEAELDPILAFPPDERERLRALARNGWEWQRRMTTLWNEMFAFANQHQNRFPGKAKKPVPAIEPEFTRRFGDRLAALGLRFDGFKSGAGGYQTYFPFAERNNRQDRMVKELRKQGLAWEHWSYFGTWTGNTFGTPVADADRVFTVTGNLLASCHDHDGRLRWRRRFPWPDRRAGKALVPDMHHARVTDAKGKFRWPFNTQGLVATSPILVDGHLVSMAGGFVRCLDGATGRSVWELPMRGGIGQNCTTPTAVELGGESFVIVPAGEGRVGPRGDEIIRVRDGKVCGILPGYSSAKMSIARTILDGEVAIHYDGDWRDREIAAYRLAYVPRPGVVMAEELWRVRQKRVRGVGLWRACVHEHRLFFQQVVFDTRTGKLLQQKLPCARRRYCWWSGMIVGPYYLSIDHQEGVFHFRDLDSGKTVGECTLPRNPPEVHDRARVLANTRGQRWNLLGAATPFPYRNRLYVRSYDYLWCLGGS